MTSSTSSELLAGLTGLRPLLSITGQEMTVRLHQVDQQEGRLPDQLRSRSPFEPMLNVLGQFIRQLNDRDTEQKLGSPTSVFLQPFFIPTDTGARPFLMHIEFGHDVGQFLAEAIALTLAAAIGELPQAGASDALMMGALASLSLVLKAEADKSGI